MEFDNYEELFNYLDNSVNNSIEEIAQTFKDVLYNFVKDKFYGGYAPVLYERTYDLLNSITVSQRYMEDGMATVDVFFDTDKIKPMISSFYVPKGMERLHHHLDRYHNPTSDIIPLLANDGWKMINGQIRPGGKFLEAMESYAKNPQNYISDLKRILAGKGITIDTIR